MMPTQEFLNSPEQVRSRLEASFGEIVVVVENLAHASHVYLSHNDGKVFETLGWKRSLWTFIRGSLHGVTWPPVRISSVGKPTLEHFTILSVEPQWSEADKYVYATYSFATKAWTVRVD